MPPLATRFALELIRNGSALARESLETLARGFQIFEASALVDVIAGGRSRPVSRRPGCRPTDAVRIPEQAGH